jgi:hypothetical protein
LNYAIFQFKTRAQRIGKLSDLVKMIAQPFNATRSRGRNGMFRRRAGGGLG